MSAIMIALTSDDPIRLRNYASPGFMRTSLLEAIILVRDKYLHPTVNCGM